MRKLIIGILLNSIGIAYSQKIEWNLLDVINLPKAPTDLPKPIMIHNQGTGTRSIRICCGGGSKETKPLYIIDEEIIDPDSTWERSPLSSIAPEDVESIKIFKGNEATALYGAIASGGVVIITTKNYIEFTEEGDGQMPIDIKCNFLPFPVSGTIHIENQVILGDLHLMDAQGRKLYQFHHLPGDPVNIDLCDYPPGNYFLQYKVADNWESIKFVVIR